MSKIKWITEDISSKVNAILSEMSLEEKIGQMAQYDWNSVSINPDVGDDQKVRMMKHWESGLVGSIFNVAGAEESNFLQEEYEKSSRLGIPLLIGRDVVHGYKSIFPIPLGLSSSWNPELIQECAAIASYEASSDGISWVFAPMIDITRDPRWGRIAETTGEDPYLTSQFARAWVEGAERKVGTDTLAVASCPKHFAGYGFAEAGRDYNTVDVSDRILREIIFPPFRAAVEEGALSIMASFNELNGIPACANRYLLTTVLREEWGFEGIVVSDYNALIELITHGIAANEEDACYLAIAAGTDVDMHSGIYMEYLPKLVRAGKVPEDWINQAVKRILSVKLKLGLFNKRRVDPTKRDTIILSEFHRKVARKAAQESIVLLENRNSTLPLERNVRSITVLGPLADNTVDPLGCWAMDGNPEDVVSILTGIRNIVGVSAKVQYGHGCSINEDLDNDAKQIQEACDLAAQADVIVLVLGESRLMSGESNSRASLDLPGRQRELVEAVAKLGIPMVVVLLCGRPLTLDWLRDKADAILVAWHPGIECGHAVGDILFGDYNPSGKLTVTFPLSIAQIPNYYYQKSTGRPPGGICTSRYIDLSTEPLYPFGYGLSYTSFHYDHLEVKILPVEDGNGLRVSVELTNEGKVAGHEIVQLYVRDLHASVTQPLKLLKNFTKIALQPAETCKVEMIVPIAELEILNADGVWLVEPGEFELVVGPNSKEGLKAKIKLD